MATGIQTGIRTGSAPLPAGKSPAGGGGGLGKVLAAWTGMSTKMKILAGVVVGVLVLATIGGVVYTSQNKPVSLYATNLTPGDITEISRRLNEWNVAYTVEGSKIMVHPSSRQRVIGLLINYGLPHRPVGSTAEGGGMAPKTEAEKKAQALDQLTAQLVDQLRQFDPVADVYVNLVPAPEDELLSGQKKEAKATIMLKLKAGMKLKKEQVEAMQTLVSGSMAGLDPKNVAITDSTAKKYTDEQGRVSLHLDSNGSSEGGVDPTEVGLDNEQLQLKRGFEAYYKRKITESLDKVVGTGNYSVAVNAEFDFAQYQVKTKQVGQPGGDNQVVTLVKKSGEDYATAPTDSKSDGKTKQAKAAPAGVPQSAGGDKTKYDKATSEIKYESGSTERVAQIPAGAVKRKTVTVAMNGKQEVATLDGIKKIAESAIGIDETAGDKVNVVALAFNEKTPVDVASFPQQGAFPTSTTSGGSGSGSMNKMWLVAGMLVPTGILLTILAIFLVRQRRVQTDKTSLILSTTPGSTTSDISDLLSDKIGRSTASTQTTRANNTEQLEKLAKEKPTKVAELLKSTWLSDKER